MTKPTFLIEEQDELYYERIENKLPKRELINLRNKYDQGWNKPNDSNIIGLVSVFVNIANDLGMPTTKEERLHYKKLGVKLK